MKKIAVLVLLMVALAISGSAENISYSTNKNAPTQYLQYLTTTGTGNTLTANGSFGEWMSYITKIDGANAGEITFQTSIAATGEPWVTIGDPINLATTSTNPIYVQIWGRFVVLRAAITVPVTGTGALPSVIVDIAGR